MTKKEYRAFEFFFKISIDFLIIRLQGHCTLHYDILRTDLNTNMIRTNSYEN